MHDEVVGAKSESALQLSAKRGDRLGVELGISAREIDKVVGVDGQRLQVVALTQAAHLGALRGASS